MGKSKRVLVSFTERQWKLIETLRGEMGDGDADIVRNIVLGWLTEKSFISESAKNKMRKNNEK
ncbi:MAG: CopG family transcriptional regulator [Candidatus Hydrothermota bacterium]|mgnify:CR=1 FL=1|nr:MAG: CopG family transcriptional regulator [Candidatus Hydrothermae bacterium]